MSAGKADDERLDGEHRRPAERQIEADGEPVEAARQEQFQRRAGERGDPDRDRQRHHRERGARLGEERGVGAADHEVDRGVVEAAQDRLGRRRRGHVVGAGEAEQQEEAGGVDRHRETVADRPAGRHLLEQNGKADDARDDRRRMHHGVGDQFAVAVAAMGARRRVGRGQGQTPGGPCSIVPRRRGGRKTVQSEWSSRAPPTRQRRRAAHSEEWRPALGNAEVGKAQLRGSAGGVSPCESGPAGRWRRSAMN